MQFVTADIDQFAWGREFLLIIPRSDGLEDETGSGQTSTRISSPTPMRHSHPRKPNRRRLSFGLASPLEVFTWTKATLRSAADRMRA
jgi:hypothetical protein